MGVFDKIRRDVGLDYNSPDTPKKASKESYSNEKSYSPPDDKDLKAMESKIQKVINDLQEIRAKLRVRRGI